MAVITAERVMTVPTERSMPPLMITNVTPRAKMPMTVVAIKIPTMFEGVKKLSDATLKMITIKISALKASKRCNALRPVAPNPLRFVAV